MPGLPSLSGLVYRTTGVGLPMMPFSPRLCRKRKLFCGETGNLRIASGKRAVFRDEKFRNMGEIGESLPIFAGMRPVSRVL